MTTYGGGGGTSKVSHSYKTSELALDSFAEAQISSPGRRNVNVASLTNADLTRILSSQNDNQNVPQTTGFDGRKKTASPNVDQRHHDKDS